MRVYGGGSHIGAMNSPQSNKGQDTQKFLIKGQNTLTKNKSKSKDNDQPSSDHDGDGVAMVGEGGTPSAPFLQNP